MDDMPTPDMMTRMNSELRKTFDAIESTPNKFTLSQFLRYKPLFMKERNLSNKEIATLRKEYFAKVDPYKETVVVDEEDGTVLITLPQQMVPFVLPTGEKYAELVAVNTKAATSIGSDDPFAQRAFQDMAVTFLKAQELNVERIKKARDRYTKVMDEFRGITRETDDDKPKSVPAASFEWGD